MDNDSLTERHVQAIWYDGELRPPALVTQTGESVRVVYPGDWNRVAGPDFTGAVLEIGEKRRRLVGDVEVHLAPADWTLHGHGKDPAYRNVVAHVTWRGGVPPPTLPSCSVSICLGRLLESDISFSPESIDLDAYPFVGRASRERPCRRQSDLDPDRVRRILAGAGKWRIKAKARRLATLLKTGSARQLFYAEVMNALGYGKNGPGFRAIASAVPYEVVRDEPENLAAAFSTAATFIEWNRDRVRPGNSPEARLEAAARLFTETDVFRLADACDVSQGGCRQMLSVLTTGRYVGRGRAAAILANVVLPFALARGQVADVPPWLPPEDICAPVRQLAFRMFGGDHNPRVWYATNGVMIQGLIHVTRAWCEHGHPACAAELRLCA